MKKTLIRPLVIGVILVLFFLNLEPFFRQTALYQSLSMPIPTPQPTPIVERLNGLKIKWQLANTFISYHENGPYMRISNGKIFYLGYIGNEPKYRIVGINETDGGVIVKTDPVEGGTEFTVDDSALFIARNISEIYRYDPESRQRVWNQALGNSHAPCCLNVINHELQIFWYPNRFYILSALDGKVIREINDAQGYVYRIEDGIRYERSGSSFLTAIKEDGTTLWEVELKSYLMAPLFTKDTIFLRTGDLAGNLYALDRASGKILWQTDAIVISNLAISSNRVYYFTSDGQLLGVNGGTGEVEKSASIAPAGLSQYARRSPGYEVAYDDSAHLVVLILGNSAQMIAFEE